MTYISLITMTNKSVMTFISVNKISVCLSVKEKWTSLPQHLDYKYNILEVSTLFAVMSDQRRRHWPANKTPFAVIFTYKLNKTT